ncbi:MAG: phosphatase [Ponticaulis sp.]|nr:phosphatase [Ponticaulis sp.]
MSSSPSSPLSRRTIFIGDVHGMLDELKLLLDEVDLQSGDRLVFLGDLVDKGPDPLGVVRHVRDLSTRDDLETHFVRGNHEDKHLRYYRNLSERPKIARQQAVSASGLTGFHEQADEDDWAFLHTSIPYLKLDDLNLLAVHGGIPGNMTELPALNDYLTASGKDRNFFKLVWITRYVDRTSGHVVGLGQEAENDPFWAEVYDGRFGHVVFGHQPFMEGPSQFPHATGIDTGAVHGGTLTALIVPSPERSDWLTVSVPGKRYSPPLGGSEDD